MSSELLSDLLWGPYTVAFVFIAGLYLGIKTRFFYFRHPWVVIKETFGSLFRKRTPGDVSPFGAMAIALGGTMGTGNITGVATAIALGGPGAVIWMLLSALAGMVLKYAETVLAMDTRTKTKTGYEGSPMKYIKLLPGAGVLSALFAIALLCSTFFGGNMVQTNAAASMGVTMGIPAYITGAVIGLVVLVLSFGGIKRVADAMALMVPFMTIAYLIAAGWAIYEGRALLPSVLQNMVYSAFDLKGLTGGLSGYAVSQAMRYGMARGLFSNEAGFGTAPIAHAASSETRPAVQGMWGVVEVFIDTVICCTITALVILLVPEVIDPMQSGAQITAGAFGSLLGPVYEGMVAIFTIVFAVASILGWYVYGEAAVHVLFGKRRWAILMYRVIYGGTCLLGAVTMPTVVWQLTDIASWLMMAINLPVVLVLSSRVKKATDRYLERGQ